MGFFSNLVKSRNNHNNAGITDQQHRSHNAAGHEHASEQVLDSAFSAPALNASLRKNLVPGNDTMTSPSPAKGRKKPGHHQTSEISPNIIKYKDRVRDNNIEQAQESPWSATRQNEGTTADMAGTWGTPIKMQDILSSSNAKDDPWATNKVDIGAYTAARLSRRSIILDHQKRTNGLFDEKENKNPLTISQPESFAPVHSKILQELNSKQSGNSDSEAFAIYANTSRRGPMMKSKPAFPAARSFKSNILTESSSYKENSSGNGSSSSSSVIKTISVNDSAYSPKSSSPLTGQVNDKAAQTPQTKIPNAKLVMGQDDDVSPEKSVTNIEQLLASIASAVGEDDQNRRKVTKETELRLLLSYASGKALKPKPVPESQNGTPASQGSSSKSNGADASPASSSSEGSAQSIATSSSMASSTRILSPTAESPLSSASSSGGIAIYVDSSNQSWTDSSGKNVLVSSEARKHALVILAEVASLKDRNVIKSLLKLQIVPILLSIMQKQLFPEIRAAATTISSTSQAASKPNGNTDLAQLSDAALCWAIRALRNVIGGSIMLRISKYKVLHAVIADPWGLAMLLRLANGSSAFLEAACDAAAIIAMIASEPQFRHELVKKMAIVALTNLSKNMPESQETQLHVMCALAEVSMEPDLYVEVCEQGGLDTALGALGCARDAQTVAEAARLLANIACVNEGRDILLQVGGAESLARRLPRYINGALVELQDSAAFLDLSELAKHQLNSKHFHSVMVLTPALDMVRALCNICTDTRGAASAICSGAPASLIHLMDDELIMSIDAMHASGTKSAISSLDTQEDMDTREIYLWSLRKALIEEARRALIIMSRGGSSHRYNVLLITNEAIIRKADAGASTKALYELRDQVIEFTDGASSKVIPVSVYDLGSARAKQNELLQSVRILASASSSAIKEKPTKSKGSDDDAHEPIRGSTSGQAFHPSGKVLSLHYGNDTGDQANMPRAQENQGGVEVLLTGSVSQRGRGEHQVLLEQLKALINSQQDQLNSEKRESEQSQCGSHQETSLENRGSTVLLQQPQADLLDKEMFELGQFLGKGGYGTVILAQNIRTSELVAIKRFHSQVDKGAIKEQRIWRKLDHENVVKYYGFFRGENNELNLVAEYIDGWSLAEHLAQFQEFPETLVAEITRQMLRGLQYLHSMQVIHRDLKPANVLVSKSGIVKITDFGVSCSTNMESIHSLNFGMASANLNAGCNQGGFQHVTNECNRGQGSNKSKNHASLVGTPWYLAPEVTQGMIHTSAVDIFSLGCTVLELATGKRPYHTLTGLQALFKMVEDGHPPIPTHLSEECQEFLIACWNPDPQTRATASQLLGYRFVNPPFLQAQ